MKRKKAPPKRCAWVMVTTWRGGSTTHWITLTHNFGDRPDSRSKSRPERHELNGKPALTYWLKLEEK